jgi:hypothetical protein
MGTESAGWPEALLWVGLLVAISYFAVHLSERRMIFFLVQAIIPWVILLFISLCLGRPLLQARYLVFAQFALVCLLAATFEQLKQPLWRLVFTFLVFSQPLLVLVDEVRYLPERQAPMHYLVRLINRHIQPEDVIIVPTAATVNIVKFYAKQFGVYDPPVRCYVDRPLEEIVGGKGHSVHVSSLSVGDVISRRQLPARARRVWEIDDTLAPLDSWRIVHEWKFSPSRGHWTTYRLRLYVPN